VASPNCRILILTLLILAVAETNAAPSTAKEGMDWNTQPTPDQIDFFESHVRPLLSEHCYECHSQGAKKLKAELRLDSRQGIMRGGESGSVISPGNAESSPLIRAIRYQEESLEMPPDRKLPPRLIDFLTDWINMGAPWPGESEPVATPVKPPYDWDKFRREHWAFRPVTKPAPPPVKDEAWVSNPIDHFILAKLEQAGLRPVERADRRTLIRRLYLDLTGLPPSPAQVDEFRKDPSSDAFAKVVDQLLESPHYGERWARHWLDVARYSDGLGGFLDGRGLPDAWRYRDWVVEAFNCDLPYDEFVKAQIAGDLIQPDRHVQATGFFAVGPTYISDGGDPEATAQAQAETLSDRVDTFSRAFLALTAACARCHDHKFDPITMKDYYSIAGIFKNSKVVETPLAPEEVVTRYATAQNAIKEQDHRIKQFLKAEAEKLNVKENVAEKKLPDEARQELMALRKELTRLQENAPAKYPTAHCLADNGSSDMPVAIRGDLRKPGESAPRRFLQILAGDNAPQYTEGSGRRQLAEAVAAPANPLTPRVMVNRIWLQHFGKALVRSPSNFGVIGETPTHPELLDWLAAVFVESGWSIKAMHRLILNSSAWQMSSAYNGANMEKDAGNILVWRMNPRKLDVEAWRDSLLAVTGELDLSLLGPPTEQIFETKRRTLYAKISRNGDRFTSDEFLRLFDFPTPRSSSANRAESTVPQQYLFMMNSRFMLDRAAALAQRLEVECDDDSKRIDWAYQLLYSRPPAAREKELAIAFLSSSVQTDKPSLTQWQQYAQVLLSAHEFMQIQ